MAGSIAGTHEHMLMTSNDVVHRGLTTGCNHSMFRKYDRPDSMGCRTRTAAYIGLCQGTLHTNEALLRPLSGLAIALQEEVGYRTQSHEVLPKVNVPSTEESGISQLKNPHTRSRGRALTWVHVRKSYIAKSVLCKHSLTITLRQALPST